MGRHPTSAGEQTAARVLRPARRSGGGPAFAAEAGGSSVGADARAARLGGPAPTRSRRWRTTSRTTGSSRRTACGAWRSSGARSAVPRFGAIVTVARLLHARGHGRELDHHVVVFLHRPNCPDCERLDLALRGLAPRFPLIEFTSALAGSTSRGTRTETSPHSCSTGAATPRDPSSASTRSEARTTSPPRASGWRSTRPAACWCRRGRTRRRARGGTRKPGGGTPRASSPDSSKRAEIGGGTR